MARQYLGVPATSATVERLFSAVGFEFADRRKSQSAETLANLAFAVSSICLIQNFNDGREAHMLMTFGSSLSTAYAICMLICDSLLAWTVTVDAIAGGP